MKRKIFLCLAALLLIAGCEKEAWVKATPDCIKDKIGQFAKEPVANPPVKIYSYQYKGRTVYYIPARCCDIPSELYDADCNFICSPDSGITGNGDGKCTDFFTTRSDEKLIWEDTRNKSQTEK